MCFLTPIPHCSQTNVVFLSPPLFPCALPHVPSHISPPSHSSLSAHDHTQSLFMFPFSPSSSTLSSLHPTLDTISELDVLSDISEDDLRYEPEADVLTCVADPADREGECDLSYVSTEHVTGSEEPHPPSLSGSVLPKLGLTVLGFCKGLRLPSLLDEDGYISLPCLPEDCAALLLPAGLHRHLPLTSPSLLPSFLLIFAVFLSACRSVVLSLLLALPLAVSLCYLEPKAIARFRPTESVAKMTLAEEMQCDPAV